MKKLMIAAALAAVTAGAYAEYYQVDASVKTTGAKSATQKSTTTVYCGLNEDDTYWWDDLGFDSDKEAKAYIKSLSNEEKAAYAKENLLDEDGVTPLYPVQEYYKGKKTWCYTFKFTEVMQDCYRVATSRKIAGLLWSDPCCDGEREFFPVYNGYTLYGDAMQEVTTHLFWRFGGVSLAKANKVEVAGEIGEFGDLYGWAFAGQGTTDKTTGVVKSVSGSVVGIIGNPNCKSCCDYDKDACFFDCEGYLYTDDEDRLDEDEDATEIDGSEGTAAFGTFKATLLNESSYMKFIRKYPWFKYTAD